MLALAASLGQLDSDHNRSIPGIRAHLQPKSYFVPLGSPVYVQFSIENVSDKPVTLTVPGAEPDLPLPEMGLPLTHVFSGTDGTGIAVTTQANRRWERPVSYRAPSSAPILLVAPYSVVGTTIDLRQYYPALRSPGTYRVTWSPYAGRAVSESAVLNITPLKWVELTTDDGVLTIQLFYADAPKSVANFIDLIDKNFYGGLTFHRIELGYFIQGGCPRGDGTGIRLDGKRVPPEFNARPHKKGSLSMALLSDDPESASCQFFICNTRQRDWDGRYTVFGQLVGEESLSALDRLMETPIDDRGRPQRSLYIRSARLIDAPPQPLGEIP